MLGASTSSKTPFFPSYLIFNLGFCPNLKGWWRNSNDDDDNEPQHLLLPCLSKLDIRECPNLTSMPPVSILKERLTLRGCSWKVLYQAMKMKMGVATTSTYFPLSQLQQLPLKRINDLESLL